VLSDLDSRGNYYSLPQTLQISSTPSSVNFNLSETVEEEVLPNDTRSRSMFASDLIYFQSFMKRISSCGRRSCYRQVIPKIPMSVIQFCKDGWIKRALHPQSEITQ
jgi:hypothetical protein